MTAILWIQVSRLSCYSWDKHMHGRHNNPFVNRWNRYALTHKRLSWYDDGYERGQVCLDTHTHTHTHVEHDITFFKTRNKYAVTFMDVTDFNKWTNMREQIHGKHYITFVLRHGTITHWHTRTKRLDISTYTNTDSKFLCNFEIRITMYFWYFGIFLVLFCRLNPEL